MKKGLLGDTVLAAAAPAGARYKNPAAGAGFFDHTATEPGRFSFVDQKLPIIGGALKLNR